MSGVKDTYLDAHRVWARQLSVGDDRLAPLRRAALAQFGDLGLPSTADEDWKYTSIRPIEKQVFTPALPFHNGVDAGAHDALAIAGLNSYRLVFINGHFAPQMSAVPALAGVHIGGLAEAVVRTPDRVDGVLGTIAPQHAHGFIVLNTAYLHDGAFIEIDAGVELDRPVELLFIATGAAVPLLAQPRNLIVAGAGSRMAVIERYVGPAEQRYLTNAVTEVALAQGARLDHLKIQDDSLAAFHVGGLFAHLDAGSELAAHSMSYGARLARHDVKVTLGRAAQCRLHGLYLGAGRQHVDNHTHIDHVAPGGLSREHYKGILGGRARAVFHGRIVVHPGAQQTDSQQSNQNLLLSCDAQVDTKPQLEIYADDVKCSHGATVGQLDETSVFYLRARGIGEVDARDLLTFAFANEVLAHVGPEPVRQSLSEKLTARLLHGCQIEEFV